MEFVWAPDPILATINIPLVDYAFELRVYSLAFLGVFLGGYALLDWQIKRGGGDDDVALDYIAYGILSVLLGGRIGHILFYDLENSIANPASIIRIWEGGLASHGSVMGLIIGMVLFTRKQGVPFIEGVDRFVFSAALGATLVRIGNLFNSEIVGRITDQSWGVRFPLYDKLGDASPLRHPTQIYEIFLGLLVLCGLFVADRRLGKEKRPRGMMVSLFFAMYFPGRFTVEFFKEYQTGLGLAEGLTMGQWLSIPGALLGFYGLWWSTPKVRAAGWRP
jgi:phosphatidylglycerol:prolipoprotein diacylglycerol transferase